MKQIEAVYQAVVEVMGEHDGAYTPTKEEREAIVATVAEGIEEGKVDFSPSARAKHDSPAKIKQYCVGLVSNWLRKDPNLNGNVKYQPKNPGSRAGQGDAQIRAMRQLVKTLTDQSKIDYLNAKIEARKLEVQAEKAKSITIDLSSIPQDLLEELGLNQ
jgi:hypothetical protein